jgi:hypothetical protein
MLPQTIDCDYFSPETFSPSPIRDLLFMEWKTQLSNYTYDKDPSKESRDEIANPQAIVENNGSDGEWWDDEDFKTLNQESSAENENEQVNVATATQINQNEKENTLTTDEEKSENVLEDSKQNFDAKREGMVKVAENEDAKNEEIQGEGVKMTNEVDGENVKEELEQGQEEEEEEEEEEEIEEEEEVEEVEEVEDLSRYYTFPPSKHCAQSLLSTSHDPFYLFLSVFKFEERKGIFNFVFG